MPWSKGNTMSVPLPAPYSYSSRWSFTRLPTDTSMSSSVGRERCRVALSTAAVAVAFMLSPPSVAVRINRHAIDRAQIGQVACVDHAGGSVRRELGLARRSNRECQRLAFDEPVSIRRNSHVVERAAERDTIAVHDHLRLTIRRII